MANTSGPGMRAVSAAYWELADQQQELERELAALANRDGSPKGFEFLGWKSASRKRFEDVRDRLTSISTECTSWQQRYQEAIQQHMMSRELDKVIDVDEASKQVLASEEIQPAPVNLAAMRSRIARIAGDTDMHLAAQILKKIG